MTPEDFDKFMHNYPTTDPRTKLPVEYHDFLDVFKNKKDFVL